MATPREKVVQQAERFVARGKVEAAIREYRKVLAENPRDTNTLNRVGDLYARLERNGEAIQLFTKIAETYTDDGFFVKAIAIYKKIIKLDPTRLDIYEKLAELYHRQGLVNEARTQYQVLADYYQKHDQLDAATGICRRMVVLEPANPSHRAKLADLLEQQGKGAEAIEQYAAIGDQMIASGQPDGAVRVYEKALDVEAETADFLHAALAKLRAAGRAEAADRLRGQALKRKPHLEAELARRDRDQPAEIGLTPSRPAKELKLIRPKPVVVAPEAEAPTTSLPKPSSAAPLPDWATKKPASADPDEIELFLEEIDEAPPASLPGSAQPAPEALPAIEFDLSLEDEVFVFDLEDDSPAASQVSPPPDMAGRPPRAPSEIPALDFEAEPLPSAESAVASAEAPAATSGQYSELDFGQGDASSEDYYGHPTGLELDPDFLERTAAEVEPGRLRQEEDLFTEAEVLAKYGLREKALERLEELFRVNPNHLGAYALQIGLYLELGRHERVVILANEMSGIAAELRQTERWDETRERLLATGYVLEGTTRVVAAPAGVRLPITQPTAEQLFDGFEDDQELSPLPSLAAAGLPALDLEVEAAPVREEGPAVEEPLLPPLDLEELAPDEAAVADAPPPSPEVAEEALAPLPADLPARPARKKKPAWGDLDAELAQIAGTLGRTRSPAAPAPPPRVVPTAPPAPVLDAASHELFDLRSIGADVEAEASLAGLPPLAITAAPVPSEFEIFMPGSGPLPVGSDGGGADVSWLDDVAAEAAPRAGGEEKLFADEEGFFDLAAELEEELRQEAGDGADSFFAQPHEQSLEEIVEGFKRGVAEHLSPEDYETHFNLGIAYREMGLLDEAIGEFQLAAKNPLRLVDCCSMLGLSFLDKSLPELAVKWYKRGIAAPGLPEGEQLGLLYELGTAYLAMGDRENARKTYVEIYGINTNYRDVVARLQELAPSSPGS